MRKENFCTGWTVRPLLGEQATPIRLPHDAMIHEMRQPQNPSGAGGGYYPGGTYVYEKRFWAPVQADTEAWVLEIEGAWRDAEVRLNDILLAENHSGYRGFFVPLERALHPGEENRLQITVRNDEQPNSRWYTGTGLYRPVWLHTGGQTCIPPQGLRIDTPQVEQAISAIHLQVQIKHRAEQDEMLTMQIVIQDRQGQIVHESHCPRHSVRRGRYRCHPPYLFAGRCPVIAGRPPALHLPGGPAAGRRAGGQHAKHLWHPPASA